jgi:hypothetical protein
MARKIDPESVSSKVAELTVGQHEIFDNPYTSIMVMVSNLKKKKGHESKTFKVKFINEQTTVTRIK